MITFKPFCRSLLASSGFVGGIPGGIIGGVLGAALLAGCAQSSNQTTIAQKSLEDSRLQNVLPLQNDSLVKVAKAASSPRASANPDPLFETRRAQQIPTWARRRVLHKVAVKPGEKVFALTFDDGPWPRYTREILQVLATSNVRATFFMVGQELQRRPEIAREVRDAGHAIGTHSWDHPSRPRDAVAQVQRTDALIKKTLGFGPTLFRPPYGILKNGMAAQAMKRNQAVVIWSTDGGDWRRPSANSIAQRILRNAQPGGIALLHDGGGNRSRTVEALPIIISTLKSRGYRFVTVPELLSMRYVAPPKKPVKKPSAVRPVAAKSATKKP